MGGDFSVSIRTRKKCQRDFFRVWHSRACVFFTACRIKIWAMTTKEVARLLGIHRTTLLSWLQSGELSEPRRISGSGVIARIWAKPDLERARKLQERMYRKARPARSLPAESKAVMRTSNSNLYAHIPTEKIIRLHREGLSARKIAKLLGMGPCSVGNRLRRNGIRGGHVSRVTEKQYRESRRDPALEARLGIRNRVICRECGELKAGINANGEHSHLRRHHMTVEEYQRKYPGARLFSFAIAAAQAGRQGRKTKLEDLMQAFAEKYLTAAELDKCRRDPFWEKHNDVRDFIVCRRCGLKIKFSNLWGHVGRHGYKNLAAYRVDFPHAPSIATAFKEGYRRTLAKHRYASGKLARGRPGRPTKTELFLRAMELNRAGHSWPQCAVILCPEEAKAEGRMVIGERLRKGVGNSSACRARRLHDRNT